MRPTAPRVSEKAVQAQIVQALRTVGAAVYVLGRPPRHESARMGTGQTPGIPDLYVLLPQAPIATIRLRAMNGEYVGEQLYHGAAHGLWIEVKAKGGRLRPQQAEFATLCGGAGIPHLVGDLDVVLAYLQQHGYIRGENVPHYRRPA